MAGWEDIRVAWNVVSEQLTATYPDDGTFPFKEVAFAETGRTGPLGELPGTLAPGGPRLILGPTLGEVIEAFGTVEPASQADALRALVAELLLVAEDYPSYEGGPSAEELISFRARAQALGVNIDAV